jgi:ABC-type amino acid transport substrate-binding protein
MSLRCIVVAARARRLLGCGVFVIAGMLPGIAQAQPAVPGGCPERLRIAFPESSAEPFMRGQGEDFQHPPGLLVDWVRQALRELGCLERAEMLRLPVRRLRAMIESGQIDAVAGVGDGGPIAALLTLPPREGRRGEFDYSLGLVEYLLYARRSSGVAWDGQTLSGLGPELRVGVTAGTLTETLAQERGWPTDPAPNHESALAKLAAGRTPVLLVHRYVADDRLRQDPRLAHQVERLLPAVEQRHLYVGLAPALVRGSKAFAMRFWRAVCQASAVSRSDGACRLPPP